MDRSKNVHKPFLLNLLFRPSSPKQNWIDKYILDYVDQLNMDYYIMDDTNFKYDVQNLARPYQKYQVGRKELRNSDFIYIQYPAKVTSKSVL